VTAGLPDVALRIPSHPLARKLLSAVDRPVAAPSANVFGRISPTSAAHVSEQFSTGIDYILDGGSCTVGVESTVVRIRSDPGGPEQFPCELLRPGGVTIEQLSAVVGSVAVVEEREHPELQPQCAPGRLPRHYAPQTPLEIITGSTPVATGQRIGLLSRGPIENPERFAVIETLSQTGDLSECAVGFFAALRRLDSADLDRILAEPFPEEGLGRALNDRLRRAANTFHA
jgi:L-threonylcarbamoyladenylate synthase